MKQRTFVLSRIKSARIIYSFLLVTTLLWAIGLPILPIGNWVDTARAAAPTFTLKWKTASTKAVLTFDQWVFNTSSSQQWGPSGGLEAADFALGGSGAPTITAVQADGGTKTVILTLSAAPTSGTTTFACAATSVYNQAGEACNSGTTVTAAGGNADSTGPTITATRPSGNNSVEVEFSEPVDQTTGENITFYTLVTANSTDTTAISRAVRQPWDPKIIRVEADGAQIDNSVTGADTITVTAGVKDIFANANQTTTAQTITWSMSGAAMAPNLEGAYVEDNMDKDGGVDASKSRVTLVFSKNMDTTTSQVGAYYIIKSPNCSSNAEIPLTALGAGDIVVSTNKVRIGVPEATCDLTPTNFDMSSFDPTAVMDSIRVKNSMNGGGPKDTDGNIQMSDWFRPLEKSAAPIVKGIGIDATAKKATVRFDKNLDRNTVAVGGFTVNTTAEGDTPTISAAALDWDQRSVVLVLHSSTNFTSGGSIDIKKTAGAGALTDILGNYVAVTGCSDNTPDADHIQCTIDSTAPTITKIKATDTNGNKLLEVGETVAIEFSEEMDRQSAWDQWAFNVLYGSTCTVTTPISSKDGCQWGSWGDGATSVWGVNGASVANSKITITLGTAPNVKSGYKIVPWADTSGFGGASDKSGNKVANVGAISLGAPTIQSVKYTDVNTSSSVNLTDTVKFIFTKSMDTATVTNGNVNTRMVLSSSHIWGTSPTIAWTTTTLTNDTLTVTLTSGVDAANNDTITPNAAVVDINGLSVSGTGLLKTAGPTVSSVTGLSTLKLVFTEAVLNTGGLEYPSQTATVMSYDATPVNLTDGTSDTTQLQVLFAFGGGGTALAAQAINYVSADGKTVVVVLNRNAAGTDTLSVTGTKGVSGIAAANTGDGTLGAGGFNATLGAGATPTLQRIEIMKPGGGTGTGPSGGSSAINAGDVIRVRFSGAMNPATITAANVGTALRLCAVGTLNATNTCAGPHSWGTVASGLAVSWFTETYLNDTVEIIPGFDHTIANGDVIDPATTVTTDAGTAITAVGDAGSPTEGSIGTLDASIARVLAVKYSDTNPSGIGVADVVTFVFSKTMNTSFDGNSADGCANAGLAANNLETKVGVPSYQGFFVDSASGSFTQRTNPWGTGAAPTMAWKKTTMACDTLEIILGGTPTIVAGATPDNIWIDGGLIQAAGGTMIQSFAALHIDNQQPTLTSVLVINDGATANTAEGGDEIAFVFSESMDQSTVTNGNVATVLDSNTVGTDYGTSPTVVWLSPNMVKVTLGATPTVVYATSTVNPTNAVKDSAGNIDNTSTAPTVTVSTVRPVSSVVLTDPDTANPGLDKNDIRVTWTDSSATTGQGYNLYILPDNVPLNLATHKPFNSVAVNAITGTASYTYNASISTFALYDDSRFTYLASGTNPAPGAMFYPLMPGSNYIAYVVTCDAVVYACTSGTPSMPSASANTQLIGEFQAFDSTMLGTMQGTGGTGGGIFAGPMMAGGNFMVEGTMPFQGSIEVPTNIKLIGIKFSGPLDQSTMTSSNITLKNITDTPNVTVTGTLAYNSSQNAITLTPASVLTASKKYRLTITRDVKNSFGVPIAGMPQPGSTEPGPFITDFKTGSGADSTAPQVQDNKVQAEGMTVSAVNINIPEMSVRFNEDMDPTTFTSSSFLLQYDATANASFSASETPLTTVSGTVEYDPFGRIAHIWLNGALPTEKDFRIKLVGTVVKDIAGNFVDGDYDGTAGGDYTFTFTTRATAEGDNAAPRISWSDTDGFHLGVGFNAGMQKSAVTTASNWTLLVAGASVSLSGANINYDAFDNSVHFDGLTLTADATYVITAGTNIKGLNNVPVDGSYDESTGTVHGFQGAGSKGCSATTFDFGCGTNDVFNPNVMTFMPINVWPMNQFANQTSRYMINFPTTQAVPLGGKIELEFPVGFDVSSADKSSATTEAFMNADINGPGTGTVTMTSVTPNSTTRKIVIVTGGAATQANDYLNFELKNIVNGASSTMDWTNNSGGHTVSITTKDSTGKTIEGPLTSMPFPLDKGGSGSISGKVTKEDGTTGVASAKIWLSTPRGGGFEKTTGSDGSFTFTGLPTPDASGINFSYWLNVEPPKSAGYLAGSSVEMVLTSTTTSVTGKTIKIKQGTSTVTGKFSYTAATLNTKQIRVWASGPDGWLEYNFTLNGKTAGNDGASACTGMASGFDACTNYTITISDGQWNIGADPFMPMNMGFVSGPPPEPDFMPPASQNISVSGTGTANFSLSTASKTITGTVTDQSSTGLSGVQVWAYDPSGTNGFGANTQTKTDGTFTLKVVPGVYKVGAGKPGLPPLQDQQVTVPATGTNTPSSLTFKFVKSNNSVKGSVLDESGNPIQFAGVNAYNATNQQFVPSSTNSSGYFTLFLPEGTWTLEVNAPGYGRLKTNPSGAEPTAAAAVGGFSYSVVIGSTASDKSGYDFKAGAGSVTYRTIAGTVKDSNSTGISGAMVWADELNASGAFTGNGNGTQTDSSGAFSIKVPANCTGADNSACTTTYRLGAHVKGVGPLPEKTGLKISATGADLVSQDWSLAATRTVTIKIYKGAIAEENLYAPKEVFIDAFNQSSNIGNHTQLKDASSGTMQLQEASYDVRAYIPGYGEVTPDSTALTAVGSENKFVVSGNSTKILVFAVSNSTITISGTATSGGTPLTSAWAHAFNRDTGLGNGIEIKSSDSGVFSITVPTPSTGSYELNVDAPGYTAFKQSTISTTTAGIAAALTQASAVISGTVYQSDGTTVAQFAHVWAEEVNGTGFATSPVTPTGTYSLAVETGKKYNVYAGNKEGKKASSSAVNAGSGATLTLSSTANIPGAALSTATSPIVDTVVPANGKLVDDSENNDIKLNIEPQDLGSSSNSYSLEIESTPALHSTQTTEPFGKEVDVSITDDSGKSVGLLNNTIDLTLQIEKSDMTTMITDDPQITTANAGDQFDKMELGYWDETKGNGTWVTASTSRKVEVKDESGDAFTVVDYDTFVTNLQSGSDNPSATGTNTNSDYYADYKITMTTSTDHLTTWAAIIQGNSDTTAPSAPGSLAVSSNTANSVVLTWTAGTDDVALHATQPYLVYRGTSTGFTPGDALASVNALTYTDTTVGSQVYEYYYRVRAQDTSNNQSVSSGEVRVIYVPTTSSSNTGSVVSTPGSSGDTTQQQAPADSSTTKKTADPVTSSNPVTSSTPSGDTNLVSVKADAATIAKETVEKIIQLVGKVRDLKQETSYEKSVVNKIIATVKSIKTELKQKLIAFVTYGTSSTLSLGAGERGGVINSFKEAFGKLPETEADWEDVVKIGNGRWPTQTSTAREDQAEKTFKKIYLRAPDRDNPKDDASVVVIAYGLRPKMRKIESERAAIKSFRAIFGKNPTTASDWDTVRAIAYSGAKR